MNPKMDKINVYVTARIGEANLARLRAVSPALSVHDVSALRQAVYGGDEAALAELTRQLADADVVFGGRFPPGLIRKLPRLKWIHLFSAGSDGALKDCPRRVTLTNSSGVNAVGVAEHALHLMLMLAKHGAEDCAHQQARRWQHQPTACLQGRTVGIIGLGRIGREVAKRCRAFEMRVIALKRSGGQAGRDVDLMLAPPQMKKLLTASDYVVLAVPYTPETKRFFGAPELAAMRPDAYLINVARGRVVDENALIEALREKRIAGAGLDVTIVEPMPPDSPFFDLPNVILTPHVGGAIADYIDRATEFFVDNLARYLAGKRRRNIVNRRRGY
jgi:phosphoglycerate dehydrogenase-like enzyme